MSENITFYLQILILLYFFAINGTYTMLTVMAFLEIHRQSKRIFIDDYAYMLKSRLVPGIAIIVPCYNEERTIVETVRSLLASKYPRIELIIVNDGSGDATLKRLIEAFDLVKVSRVFREDIDTSPVNAVYKSPDDVRLLVIDKENGGKADSLNAGINACHMSYFLSIDADVILDEDALLRIMKPVLDDRQRTVAAGGIVRIVNDCDVRGGQVVRVRLPRRPLLIFQIVEYLRAFTAGRAGFARADSLVIVSGAFGVFSSSLIREIGGYDRKTVGEDFEILVRLHRYLRRERSQYRVSYAAFPICWTEAPETLRVLGRQRSRWQRGLSETLWSHRSMMCNPAYGRIGLFALPVFLLFEWLGPLVEAAGYAYFLYLIFAGLFDFWFFLLFLLIAVLWGMLLSVTAVAMQDIEFKWYESWRSLGMLLGFAVAENLGYRQLTVIWRFRGLVAWIFRRRGWGAMPRKGFATSSDCRIE